MVKSTNPRLALRSKLAVPPRLRAKNNIEAEKSTTVRQEEYHYNMLTLIQYLSADFPRYDGSDIQLKGLSSSLHWSICGRGRTFLVRRFPTGIELDEHELFRPSHALKCLRSFNLSNKEEESLRYRSLIQELRILRHPPLAKHPNLLRIFEVSWELDILDSTKVLPTISTEFAAFGTLQSFLLSIEESDWPMKRRLLLDVVEGLSALHSCSIVHGDLKMENVLVIQASDGEECPVIAKLSDFGFSLDVSQQSGYAQLIGFTPLWAAPEASQKLSPKGLQLTDVYSLGFIVWNVAIWGCNLFEALQEDFGAETSTAERVEMFKFWKECNEILPIATAHVNDHSGDLVGDILQCCTFLTHTLQFDPAERNLALVLEELRGEPLRRKGEETSLDIQFAPLTPFKTSRIEINKNLFGYGFASHMAMEEISRDLELLTLKKTFVLPVKRLDSDDSIAWRYPSDHCTVEAQAAFALCHTKLHDRGGRGSFERAMYWLKKAAITGHTIARVLCGRLREIPSLQISSLEEAEWLQGPAKMGSRIALAQLKERHQEEYQRCLKYFGAEFWVGVYAIPEMWRDAFRNQDGVESKTGAFSCAEPISAAHWQIRKFITTLCCHANERSETPLFLACRSGHISVVQYLLSEGADAGICNRYSENALHWLDSFENIHLHTLVPDLCRHGAKVDQVAEPDNTFFPAKIRGFYSQWYPGTPSQRAVVSGNTAAVCTLLEAGASPSRQYRGITAVDRAAQLRQADILNILLRNHPSFDLNEERVVASGRHLNPLHRAIESMDKVQLLYVHGSQYADTLKATMSIILRHKIDISSLVINPIHYAAEKFNSEALQLMLEHQDVEIDGRETKGDLTTPTPLIKALYNEDEESTNILLQHGVDPKAELNFRATIFSTLHLCILYWHKHTRIAKTLIGLGADVNHNKDPDASDSPLVYALFNNQFDMADLLLRHGAGLSIGTPTARHGNAMGEILYAQPSRLIHNAIRFLFEHPLKPEIPFIIYRVQKRTVFHSICSMVETRRKGLAPADFLAIFALLREVFPESHLVNIPDAKGLTPLHYAVWYAFPEAVRVLLEAGADPFYAAGPRTSGEGDMPPIPTGMSVLEMVEKGSFCPLLGFAKVNVEERIEWEDRRREVRALIEPYT